MATVLAFHAHPDDEVLLTGGTLARLSAEGHRVIIVVACDGVMGPANRSRLDELEASAAVLGAARVEHLGYADSGHGPVLYPDPPDRPRFVRADLDTAAAKLAALLRDENVDLLLGYDPRGGYGHPDHVKVHEVGARAAALTATPLREATLPREPIVTLLRLARTLHLPIRYDVTTLREAFSPRTDITHRFDVRPFTQHKRRALAAHQSQVQGTGRIAPVLRGLLRLPPPLFRLVLGTEWFIDPTGAPARTAVAEPSLASRR